MGRRKKTLAKRLYTFEQLDAKWRRGNKRGTHGKLYGNVKVGRSLRTPNALRVSYTGKRCAFNIAHVHRGYDGSTVYHVLGIGAARNKPSMRRNIDLWMRYAPVFTPLDPGERLCSGSGVWYRLHNGEITRLHSRPGLWLSWPSTGRPSPDQWMAGNKHVATFPNFQRRCRLFATRLKKSLADLPDSVMQLIMNGEHPPPYIMPGGPGVELQVFTPPTEWQDGRALTVKMCMHDVESRHFHHVDGDFGMAHNQFFALEIGKKLHDMLRWKCSKDAIVGIKEWIIGDIYIPGPG